MAAHMEPPLALALALLHVAQPSVPAQSEAQAFADAEYVTPQTFLARLKEVSIGIRASPSTTDYVSESELQAFVAEALSAYGIAVVPSGPIRVDLTVLENVTEFIWNDDPDDTQDTHDIAMSLAFTTRGVFRRGTELYPVVASPVKVERASTIFQNNQLRTAFFGDETRQDMLELVPAILQEMLSDVASNSAQDTTPWYAAGWSDSQKAEAHARFVALMSAPNPPEGHLAGLDVMPTMTTNSGGTSEMEGCQMPVQYLDAWRDAFSALGWTRSSAEAPLYFDHFFGCDALDSYNAPHYQRLWNTISLRETNFVFVLDGRIVRKPAVIYSWNRLMIAENGEDVADAIDDLFDAVGWESKDLRAPAAAAPPANGPAETSPTDQPVPSAPPGVPHGLVPVTPAGWSAAHLEFPLEFAPDIALEGVEELRYAPGGSGPATQTTYLFGLDVRAPGGSEVDVDRAFLEDFLSRYYRGWCGSSANSRGIAPHLERIRAVVAGGGAAFTASVELSDVFGDGAALTLALDVLVHPKPRGVELLFLAAPTTAGDDVRAQLSALGQTWRDQRPVPVFLNHVQLIPDLATYEALAASQLLRELAVVEERTTRRGDTEYTGLYVYGRHTYVQFLKPDPALGFVPGGSGVAFCVELPGGSGRVASALEQAGITTYPNDVTRELDGAPCPWFKALGFQAATNAQRLQLFALEFDPQYLQCWHPPALAEPPRIDRAAILARTASVLGAEVDAPFADVGRVGLTLDAQEHESFARIARGLGLEDDASSSGAGALRGAQFRVRADRARRGPGGVAYAEFELRRPLEEQRIDFGQVELSIAGTTARFTFIDGLPAELALQRKLAVPALARGLSFFPDGQRLAASSYDGKIHVFDVASALETAVIVPANAVGPIAIAPDGRVLVAGGDSVSNYPVRVFDLASGKELHELAGHTNSTEALRFSPDGAMLASAGNDGTIRLWDARRWEPLRTIDCGQGGSALVDPLLRGIAFSPDGRRIAGFGGGRAENMHWEIPLVRVWDVASGALTAELTGHAGLVAWGDFSADGQTLFTASADRSVRAWDLGTGAELRRRDCDHVLYGAGLSPDRKTIVVSHGAPRLIDAATFEDVASLGDPALHRDVSCFSFSADGRWLASDGDHYTVDLWELSAR